MSKFAQICSARHRFQSPLAACSMLCEQRGERIQQPAIKSVPRGWHRPQFTHLVCICAYSEKIQRGHMLRSACAPLASCSRRPPNAQVCTQRMYLGSRDLALSALTHVSTAAIEASHLVCNCKIIHGQLAVGALEISQKNAHKCIYALQMLSK